MNKLLELYEKRNKAVADARAFLNERRGSDDTLNADDAATYERMENHISALGSEIEREKELSTVEAALRDPTSNPIVGQPGGDAAKTGRSSAEYHKGFFAALRGGTVSNALSVGTDADGGYLVPTEFETTLVRALDDNNVVRSIAKVISTSSERKIPVEAIAPTAAWTAESAAITETGAKFSQKSLDAYKLANMLKVSSELLQDSMFNLEAYISDAFGRAFGAKEEEAFCIGDGTGKPTGVFTANGGEVGVTTAGAKIVDANLIDLVYSLKRVYRARASFLTNDDTIRAIRKMKDSNDQFLWQPALTMGEPDRLCGFPVYTSPFVPTVAPDAFVMAFGDFQNYWIADRAGRSFRRLNELFAGTDQVGFMATQRVDGKVILSEGIKLLKMAAPTGP